MDYIRERAKSVGKLLKSVDALILGLLFCFGCSTWIAFGESNSVAKGIDKLQVNTSNNTDKDIYEIQKNIHTVFRSLIISLAFSMGSNMVLFFSKKNKMINDLAVQATAMRHINLPLYTMYSFAFIVFVALHIGVAVFFFIKVKSNDHLIYKNETSVQLPLSIDQLFSGISSTQLTVIGTHYVFVVKIFLEILEVLFVCVYGRTESNPSAIPELANAMEPANSQPIPKPGSSTTVEVQDPPPNTENPSSATVAQYSVKDEGIKIDVLETVRSNEEDELLEVIVPMDTSTPPKNP